MTGHGLTRRGLAGGAMAAGVAAATPSYARVYTHATLGTRRSIHFNSGLLRDPLLGPSNLPVTFGLAMRLEDEPIAIRIGFGNDIAPAYPITAAAACIGTTYGDCVTPGGPAAWTRLTTNAGGRDTDPSGPSRSGQSRALAVPGNGGGPRVPNLAWTDWAPIRSVPPDDDSGRPILFLRVSCPPWSAPRCSQLGNGFSNTPNSAGRDVTFMLGGGDWATSPEARIGGFRHTDISPVYCVQYLSRTRGATVLWGGDSHFAGDTTPGNISAFVLQSCLRISTPPLPVAAANYAWGGSPSMVFQPLLEHMVASLRPEILVLQGWSANDGPSPEAAQAYATRILHLAAQARAQGTVPILVTRFARKTLAQNPREITFADHLRQQQLSMRAPDMPVLDATPILEDPTHPGLYRPGLSNDGIHPNGAGHAALAAALTPMLENLLRKAS